MTRKRNAYEALADLFRGSSPAKPEVLEQKIFNPLPARLGDTLELAPDLAAMIGTKQMDVNEIDEYSYFVDGSHFLQTDYQCNWSQDGENNCATLRVIPRTDPRSSDTPLYSYVLLKPVWQEDFSKKGKARSILEQELNKGKYYLKDPNDNRHHKAVYTRINDNTTPFEMTVSELVSGESKISKYALQYWDFVRDLSEQEGGGQELFFVELQDANGVTTGYVGREITKDDFEVVQTQAFKEMQA